MAAGINSYSMLSELLSIVCAKYVHKPDDEQFIIYIFHESDKFEVYFLQTSAKKVLIL
jgi:hypothetical protein